MNDQSVAFRSQRLVYTHQGLGGRSLQKRAPLFVNWPAQKVVLRSVANVELDSRIEFDDFHQIGLTKRTGLSWQLLPMNRQRDQQRKTKSDGLTDWFIHSLPLIN